MHDRADAVPVERGVDCGDAAGLGLAEDVGRQAGTRGNLPPGITVDDGQVLTANLRCGYLVVARRAATGGRTSRPPAPPTA